LWFYFFHRPCGELLNESNEDSKKNSGEQDVPESPRTTARLSKLRVCMDTLAADYDKALRREGTFYIDYPGDAEPPHAMAYAQGGWHFTANGPVVRDGYLPKNTQTGRV
jgi:hypothetical protein